MDCCNYVPYRHHQGYYGYYNEPLPPYHGEFYGHHNMYHDYYGNINPYYSPHQHWQSAGVFAPPDYVYNPKEARLRKAMREAANRDRSIGASPMLPRPSARRAGSAPWGTPGPTNVGGGPVTPTPHGPHEEPLIMSPMGQGMRGPGLDSPCFPSAMSSTPGGINGNGSDQFIPPSMGAATPAPGYAATKMHRDSPLPPPPAPTPGVHSPYMQNCMEEKMTNKSVNISEKADDLNGRLMFTIQIDRDSQKRREKQRLKKIIQITDVKKRRKRIYKRQTELKSLSSVDVEDKKKSQENRKSSPADQNTKRSRGTIGGEVKRKSAYFDYGQSPFNYDAEMRDTRTSVFSYTFTKTIFNPKYRLSRIQSKQSSTKSFDSAISRSSKKTLQFLDDDDEYSHNDTEVCAAPDSSCKDMKPKEHAKIFQLLERRKSQKVEDYQARRKSEKLISLTEYIKRKQQNELNRQNAIKDMRMKLPNYGIAEIRELRLPFHEAIIQNLEDEHYFSTVSFIKELLAYQDEQMKLVTSGASVYLKPLLKSSKEIFRKLVNGLKTAEKQHNNNRLLQECEELLKLGIYFTVCDLEDWHWLGEQLLLQLIKVSTNYSSQIGNKYEALSRYVYGKYLVTLQLYDSATKQFKLTRFLSAGQPWTNKIFHPQHRGTLFMQANHALYDCLIHETRQYMMKGEYDAAVVVADQARKRALEACHRNGETRALVLKGICEMENMRIKSAISSFLRAYSIQKRFGSVEGLCKIRIHLSKAYLIDNCANSALTILMELKADAEQYNLPFYLALAYKNLAHYCLLSGYIREANILIQQSLDILKQIHPPTKEVASANVILTLSKGLEMFPDYTEILLRAGFSKDSSKEQEASLRVLLMWKETRTPFYSDSFDNISTASSTKFFENIVSDRRISQAP